MEEMGRMINDIVAKQAPAPKETPIEAKENPSSMKGSFRGVQGLMRSKLKNRKSLAKISLDTEESDWVI